jgi:hypothetical protein
MWQLKARLDSLGLSLAWSAVFNGSMFVAAINQQLLIKLISAITDVNILLFTSNCQTISWSGREVELQPRRVELVSYRWFGKWLGDEAVNVFM